MSIKYLTMEGVYYGYYQMGKKLYNSAHTGKSKRIISSIDYGTNGLHGTNSLHGTKDETNEATACNASNSNTNINETSFNYIAWIFSNKLLQGCFSAIILEADYD